MRQSKLFNTIISLALLTAIVAGCAGLSTIPVPEPAPAPTATLPSPPLLPENSTPQALRSYLDAWPEERKLVIEQDVVAIFTYPHPVVFWDQTASLYHVPSMSRVDLNSNGEVAITHYRNEEGRQRLQRILTDDSRMKLIRSLIPWR